MLSLCSSTKVSRKFYLAPWGLFLFCVLIDSSPDLTSDTRFHFRSHFRYFRVAFMDSHLHRIAVHVSAATINYRFYLLLFFFSISSLCFPFPFAAAFAHAMRRISPCGCSIRPPPLRIQIVLCLDRESRSVDRPSGDSRMRLRNLKIIATGLELTNDPYRRRMTS